MLETNIPDVLISNFDPNSIIIKKVNVLPAFISIFLDELTAEVVLVHGVPIENENFEETLPAYENTSDSFSVTSESCIGQPLDCPFSPLHNISVLSQGDNTVVRVKDEIRPVSISEARKCGAIFTLETDKKTALWSFCNAQDANKTFLMNICEKDGWVSRSWAILHSWSMNERNIDCLVLKHVKLFNVQKNQAKLYFSSTFIPDIDIVNKSFLKVSWTASSVDVPVLSAKTKFILNFKVGYEGSAIETLWNNLLLLQKFLAVIKSDLDRIESQESEGIKIISEKFNESSDDQLEVESKLMLLFKDSNSGALFPYSDSSSAPKEKKKNLLSFVSEAVANKRDVMDFTDKLWNILKSCCSYKELRSHFESVFHQIRKKTLKPIIQRSNGTRLAHVIRSLIADSAYDFELTADPLEYLIEIGIEKLKNDFLFILASVVPLDAKLAMPNVPSFKDAKSSNFSWIDICSNLLTWLGKLHTSLEVLLLTQSKLNLNFQILDRDALSIVYSILDHYTAPSSPISSLHRLFNNVSHSFSMDINTTLVSSIIKHSHFEDWKLSIKNEDEHSIHKSVFLCSKPDIFPSTIVESQLADMTINCTVIASKPDYICASLHTVADCF